MATDFGRDLRMVPDLSDSSELTNGLRTLAEAIYRRLTTQRGSLAFHPDYGTDVKSFLNDSLSGDGLFAIKQAIERECEKDERVFEAECQLTFVAETQSLKLSLSFTTAAGPFSFAIVAGQLTTDLIIAQGG